jgi:hypothetical protein
MNVNLWSLSVALTLDYFYFINNHKNKTISQAQNMETYLQGLTKRSKINIVC